MKNITGVELYYFIKPHLGRIFATGSHSADCERLKYIEVRTELINCLLEDLIDAYSDSCNSHEHSVQMINGVCLKEMKYIYSWLHDYIYEANKRG